MVQMHNSLILHKKVDLHASHSTRLKQSISWIAKRERINEQLYSINEILCNEVCYVTY